MQVLPGWKSSAVIWSANRPGSFISDKESVNLIPETLLSDMEPDLPNYYIIDILPKQVPASSTGQYFKIERYFLNGPQFEEIIKKFSSLLIKLNCYFDLTVYCGKVVSDTNPSPEDICHFLKESVRNHKPVLFYMNKDKGQFHIDFSGDDHYMGLVLPYLYPGLLGLIKQLATAEGLFVWPRQFVDQNE